mmetsp:Transcript_24687/g.36197  ORF Transcript_24687/g.36197 Transcript_24687/m.36197 type:complete len:290 (-) Transcript_24687:133-1002(-)
MLAMASILISLIIPRGGHSCFILSTSGSGPALCIDACRNARLLTCNPRKFQTSYGSPWNKSGFASISSLFLSSTSSVDETPEKTLDDGEYTSEQVIKKSRFIGIAKHCESWDEAQMFIRGVRAEHPKARHVCFGFVSGSNPVQERCSDDGEPTGTAGPPILGGIKGEGLSDTVCAVVRYSGGIKLGAGGLIRAYGGTARLVLRVAPTQILIPKSTFRVALASAANMGQVYDAVNKFSATLGMESYGQKGEVEMTIVCDTAVYEVIRQKLRDSTRGEICFPDDIEDKDHL